MISVLGSGNFKPLPESFGNHVSTWKERDPGDHAIGFLDKEKRFLARPSVLQKLSKRILRFCG
jgi:hypothetical protein